MLASKGNPLIAGTPLDQMGQTIKVKVVRAFCYGGQRHEPGAVLTMPSHFALEARALGRAEIYVEPAEPEAAAPETTPAPEPRRRGRPRKEET